MRKAAHTPTQITSAEPATAELNDAQRAMLAEFQAVLEIPNDEAEEIYAAVKRGETVAEFYGYTPEVCNAIEHVALAHYRTARYEQAVNIFAWLVDATGGTSASGWRGIGACHQAMKQFEAAAEAYRRALELEPNDALSHVFRGECLCHLGQRDAGLAMLRGIADKVGDGPSTAPHILRARAILAAQGARPTVQPQAAAPRQTPPANRPDVARPDLGIDAAVAKEAEAHTFDEAMQQVMAQPELKAQLDRLTAAVRNRELTLKEVADFSDEQMDAGYAVACQFLERGDPIKAMETVGWLLWIDARDGRFYQLAGICMHHLKLWCIADYLYDLALDYGSDKATTLVYRGEVKIMLDEKAEAASFLTQGVKLAEGNATLNDIYNRGRFLLKQLNT